MNLSLIFPEMFLISVIIIIIMKELLSLNLIKKCKIPVIVFVIVIGILFLPQKLVSTNPYSGIYGNIISGFIAGLITFWAMNYIDYKSEKRWLNEVYARKEAELWLNYRTTLIITINFLKRLAEIKDGEFNDSITFEISEFRNSLNLLKIQHDSLLPYFQFEVFDFSDYLLKFDPIIPYLHIFSLKCSSLGESEDDLHNKVKIDKDIILQSISNWETYAKHYEFDFDYIIKLFDSIKLYLDKKITIYKESL